MDAWTPDRLSPAVDSPTGDPQLELLALRDGRGVHGRASGDRLDLRGRDAADLLHRLSASEVRDLPVGSAARAIFTDDKGRIVDIPLLCTTEAGLSLLCGPGRGETLRAWIERFLITEDATVAPTSARFALGLVGDHSVHAVADALDELVEHDDSWEDADVLLAADNALGVTLGHLEVEVARSEALLAVLAESSLVPCGERALRQWRIESGRALPGPALAPGANPLELGYRALVSFTKGCYVGQEVVARLDTYDKVKRHLAWLDSAAAAPAQSDLEAGGKKVGRVLESALRLDGKGAVSLVLIDQGIGAGTTLQSAQGPGVTRALTA